MNAGAASPTVAGLNFNFAMVFFLNLCLAQVKNDFSSKTEAILGDSF